MLKIIHARVGEGKSRECVREIENKDGEIRVGVYSEDGDFEEALLNFGNRERLQGKTIEVYQKESTPQEVLQDGHKYDMIILDLVSNYKDLLDDINQSDTKDIIITQQMPNNM